MVWKLEEHDVLLSVKIGCVRTIVVWKHYSIDLSGAPDRLRENHSGMETESEALRLKAWLVA